MNKLPISSMQRMSSREIAQITGKAHAHVMRDIKNVEPAYVQVYGAESKFGLGSYKDQQNQERPEYQLTKSQTLFLVSGYNPVLRAKIQKRWEDLESERTLTRRQLAQMVIDQEDEIDRLTAENTRMKPRDEFVSIAYESTDTLTLRDVAKTLNLPYGGTTLAVKLREHGLFFKNQNKPRQEYMNIYFDLIQVKTPVGFKPQVRVTQRGLALIAKVLGVVAVQQQLNMQ